MPQVITILSRPASKSNVSIEVEQELLLLIAFMRFPQELLDSLVPLQGVAVERLIVQLFLSSFHVTTALSVDTVQVQVPCRECI